MTSKHISFSQSKLPTDVEIIIFDKTYHLHSTILRQFPGFFDAGLSSTWWKEENTINGPGSIKYSYELLPDEGGDLMLLPVGPSVCKPHDIVHRGLLTPCRNKWEVS
jgi:hypothetical protein